VFSSNWPYSWPMVMDLGFSTKVRTWCRQPKAGGHHRLRSFASMHNKPSQHVM
jgi:hypothetical protein